MIFWIGSRVSKASLRSRSCSSAGARKVNGTVRDGSDTGAGRSGTAAWPLIGMVSSGSRASLKALIGIYSRLLERISNSGYQVLAGRVRVPAWEKLWILARCAI